MKSILLAIAAWLCTAVPTALAQQSSPVARDHVVVELVSEVESIQPGRPFRVGLSIEHEPEWHTYWRNPGDSGLETRFSWSLPDGFEAGSIQWPWPERHAIGHLVNYGYSDRILLPVEISPPPRLEPGRNVTLELQADWLVCKIECIPGSAELAITLPIGQQGPSPSARAAAFTETDRRRPKPVDWQATYAVDANRIGVRIHGVEALDPESLAFFPAHPTLVEHADEPFFALDGDTLQISQKRSPYFSSLPEATQFVLVDTRNDVAWRIDAQAGSLQTTAPAAGAGVDTPLPVILLMALAGGILLNLMPCVFPVLSLKALSLVSGSVDRPRAHAGAYACGVLASFALLAAGLLGLRSAGEAIGWGFQLQSPWFVGALAYLLFAMALSLSGMFEIGGRWMGAGQGLTERRGLRGSFFTGVLATLVASPCTAPFMGTALGLAITLPTDRAMAVFLALGAGLALPLTAVGMVPALARLLPKPGPWMDTFRQLMAFPLYLTVVWLAWVFARQTGADGVAALLTGLVALSFALWLAARPASNRPGAWMAHSATAIAIVVSLAALAGAAGMQTESTRSPSGGFTPFSAERLAEIKADPERAAFVNMTAYWCVTCLVNERVALSTDAVRTRFRESGVVYLKGDWTRRDPEITRYLAQYGRNGVPLYVFYPADDPTSPVVLPQILTPGTVLEFLD